jgi:pantetheine-phosphate adenylyltransferase
MKTMPNIAFYAGSFDPPTDGHLDVIRRALALADELVIAIGTHPGKAPLFSAEERQGLLETVVAEEARGKRVRVTTFNDLTVHAARREGASILIRGLRDGTDLDYEMQLAGMNSSMAPDIQTVFVPASPPSEAIWRTSVAVMGRTGGDVSGFVPQQVLAALQAKFAQKA